MNTIKIPFEYIVFEKKIYRYIYIYIYCKDYQLATSCIQMTEDSKRISVGLVRVW